MTISTGLGLALGISIILNIFTAWYARALLGRFSWISQNINDLVQIISVFRVHLEEVRKLVTEPIEYEDESETQQQEEQNAEKEVQEKHVLYAGTRERNN